MTLQQDAVEYESREAERLCAASCGSGSAGGRRSVTPSEAVALRRLESFFEAKAHEASCIGSLWTSEPYGLDEKLAKACAVMEHRTWKMAAQEVRQELDYDRAAEVAR